MKKRDLAEKIFDDLVDNSYININDFEKKDEIIDLIMSNFSVFLIIDGGTFLTDDNGKIRI